MSAIDIPEKQIAALKARAAEDGLTLEAWLRKLAAPTGAEEECLKPKKSAYGLLASYGPGPTEQEIDENRKEIFRGPI